MLEEHANLSKQAMLNLRTLTGGSNDYRMVSQALKVLDLEEESLSHKGKSTNFPAFEDSNAAETTEDDEVSSLATQDQEDILVEIEKMDLDEKVAVEVFVALEKERRSWKENKKLKLAQRKDRRHFADRSSRPYGAPRQKGRRSMNVEAIKKVSRCSNCGERGHWAEDCKKPYRSKADRLEQEKQAKGGNNRNSPSAFVFLGTSSSSSAASTHPNLGAFNYFIEEDHISDYDQDTTIPQTLEEHYVLQKDNVEKKENAGAQSALRVFAGMAIPEFAQQVLDRFRSSPSALSQVFIALPAGHAIVDPGAGQDLIGMPAYNKLRKKLASCGLQPIQLEEEPGAASGVGGKAKTLFLALIPCVLGGAPGIVKITVVQQDIPHLLSIGLLESLGSVIDIKGNVLKYENYDSEDPMHRMSSGHRTIDVTKWEGGEFPVPQQVRDQYGLQSGAFNLDDSFASEAYMELPHAAVGRRGLEVESIVTHVHNQPIRGFYTPSSEDCNNLEDIRITLRQHEDGSLSHEVDSWRLPGDIKVEELSWTGITVFVKKSTTPSRQSLLCSKFEAAPFRPSYATAASLDAARAPVAMASPGERSAGQGARPRQGQDQGRETLPTPSELCGAGAQSIRRMGQMPTMQDQAGLSGVLNEDGRQEEEQAGQGDRVCGDHEPCRDQEDPEGQGRGGIEFPRVSGTGGAAELSAGVESSAADGHDDGARAGHHSSGLRTTSSSGDDATVHEQPDHAHDDSPTDTRSDDTGNDRDDAADSSISRRGRVGNRRRATTLPLMHQATTPNVACRLHHGLARYARKTYFMDTDEVKVAWSFPELKDYINDEDLNDDYESGIPAGVKKAARRALQAEGFMDDDTDVEPNGEPSPDPPTSPDVLMEIGEPKYKYRVMELFSPPRVTAELMTGQYKNIGATEPAAFDLECGWDFFDPQDRKMFWQNYEEQKPDLVIMTPICRAFSVLMSSNWDRMDEMERKRLQKSCMAMFQFCVQVADEQLDRGREFVLEQPDGASSWSTHAAAWLAKQEQVLHVAFDQCMLGLQVHPDGLSKKRTAFMLNHLGIADEIVQYQCDDKHYHVRLEGGLPLQAQVWPSGLIHAILRGVQRQLEWSGAELDSDSEDSPENEDNLEEDQPTEESTVSKEQELSQTQKDLVRRLHHNMGHLPVERMVAMLKAAKAQPKIIKYVRDKFNCETCMKQRRQISRRRAAYPRTFEFNRIVGADVFFVKWGSKKVPFLNLVDHGSNWQCVVMVRPAGGGDPSNGNPNSETRGTVCWAPGFGLTVLLKFSSRTVAWSSVDALKEVWSSCRSCTTWPTYSPPGRMVELNVTDSGLRTGWS